jgi:hypothetical protein
MTVATILNLLRSLGYTDGQTLTSALTSGRLSLTDIYDPCTSAGHPCSHQATCFNEHAPPPTRQKKYIAVATQVGSNVISFGTKGCGN